MFLKNTLIFCLLLGSLVVICSAQTSKASVKGMILDQSDARIANGKILIEGEKYKKEILANEDGEYKIQLPIGTYRISVRMDGFYESKPQKLTIKSNQSIELNFTLVGIRNDSEHP